MNRPGIFSGIFFALAASIAAAAANLLLSAWVSPQLLISVTVTLCTLGYLIFLLKHSQAHTGRIITMASGLLVTVICWLFELSLVEQVLIQAGFICLVRSLYFYESLIAAAIDATLVLCGLLAAAWAITNTASLSSALWAFFLTQSLFALIPRNGFTSQRQDSHFGKAPEPGETTMQQQQSFSNAHRVALDAVRKLTTQ